MSGGSCCRVFRADSPACVSSAKILFAMCHSVHLKHQVQWLRSFSITLLEIVSGELAEGSRAVPESSASRVEARREAAVSFTGIELGTAGSCTADESKPNDGSTSA
jgi:hypothetical protein